MIQQKYFTYYIYQIIIDIKERIQLMQKQDNLNINAQQDEDNYRFQFEEKDSWKNYLRQNGFVVVKKFMKQEKCQQYVEEFWDVIELLSQNRLDRKDPQTQILGKNYPPVLHGGMIQYIAHTKTQWEIRRICKPIFQKLWDTENLKSSFDGLCFMNGKRRYKPRKDDAFLHCDQSPQKDYIWSYQGVMCLTDSGQNQGGFVCVPKSHLYHQRYFKQKNLLGLKQNWFVVPQNDKKKTPLNKTLKVNTEAGDFILFDSRTFHCNTVPTKDILRVCTYVCMIPSQKVSPQILQKRKQGLKDRRTSNHHPGDGFKLFPRVPRYIQNPKQFQKLLNNVNNQYKLNKQELSLI